MSLSAAGLRAAMRQLQEIRAAPIDGLTVRPTEVMTCVEADLRGPVGTPFEGGVFHVVLQLGEGFPEVPPKGYFRTKIFHPNVSEKGEICVDSLKKDWDPSLGLRHVLSVIRCLLIEPNPASALNEDAGRLLLENYAEYAKRAQMMTSVYAMSSAAAAGIIGGDGASAPSPSSSSVGLREATLSSGNATAGGAQAQPTEANKASSCVALGCGSGAAAAGSENDAAAAAQKKAAADKKKALKRL